MNYAVYLSSTLKDLEAEREAVRQALSDECVIKHSYLASERALVDSCLEDVANCDAYILILGLRYGYVPEAGGQNPRSLSITELEYEQASNKPRLVFIKDEESIPYALTDAKTKEHPLERIESFRKRASLDQRAAVFKTSDDLKLAVVKAFNAFKDDREGGSSEGPGPSWGPDRIYRVLVDNLRVLEGSTNSFGQTPDSVCLNSFRLLRAAAEPVCSARNSVSEIGDTDTRQKLDDICTLVEMMTAVLEDPTRGPYYLGAKAIALTCARMVKELRESLAART